MKKVALISPKGDVFGKSERIRNFLLESETMNSFKLLWTGPNLGLLTIASLLPEEWDCEYIDENYKQISYDNTYDIVFISAMTQQINNAYAIAEKFKNKGTLTVIGGIHATLLPDEALKYTDVVVCGEAERLVPEFLADLEENKSKSIYKEEHTGSYQLNVSPIPRFELLEGYNYPVVTLQTTRGCPHDCSFCAASKVYGRSYRRKDNAQIIEELKILKNKFSDSLIMFADDNLFVRRKACKELLKQMADMDIRWIAQSDISIATDEELLRLMVKAGCQWLVIGFESVSYNSLKDLDSNNWKLRQLEHYKNKIETIQDFGIGIYGTFIVGLDEDTNSVFDETCEFILETKLYGVNITVPTPLPGTKLREQLLKQNRILQNDWSYYTFWDINIKPKNFTEKELEEGLIYVYKSINDSVNAEVRLRNLRKMVKRQREIIAG